jgi:hypothetical protein
MTRCNECNGIVARVDFECYLCGQPIPGAKKRSWHRKKEVKPVPPLTPLSNLLFIASLLLTVVSFVNNQKMSLWLSVTLSGTLLVARVFADRIATRRQPD